MPKRNTPAEMLAAYSDRRDSDGTPQSIGSRYPMWLFRMVMRAGIKHKAEDIASCVRLCAYLGADRLLSGDVPRLADDSASAMKGEGFMGAKPPRKKGEEPSSDTYSTEDVLRSLSVDKLLEEIASRRPDLVICPASAIAEKVAAWATATTEKAVAALRSGGVQSSLELS